MDITESAFAPMIDYFDLYKKCYIHYHCSCHSHYYKKKVKNNFSSDEHNEYHEKIIKSYFNIWYIKFFYLLQKDIKLNKNIRNINFLINKFINLLCNIDCNKMNYMICIIILFLINLFMVINIKVVLYLLFINKVKFITNTRQIVSFPTF